MISTLMTRQFQYLVWALFNTESWKGLYFDYALSLNLPEAARQM